MKQPILAFLLMVLSSISTGCASPYLADRGRDAADIITVGIGIGGGSKARIGPIQAGLLFDIPYRGLRGGECVTMTPGDIMARSADFALVLVGYESFLESAEDRGKKFTASSMEIETCGANIPFLMLNDKDTDAPYYYTQLECVIGLVGTVRIGFNPGELLDFILGWATIDIFNDDVTTARAVALDWTRQKALTLEQRRQIRDETLKQSKPNNHKEGTGE